MSKAYSIKIDLVLADLNYYSRPAESVRTGPENKLCKKKLSIFRTGPENRQLFSEPVLTDEF